MMKTGRKGMEEIQNLYNFGYSCSAYKKPILHYGTIGRLVVKKKQKESNK